MLADYDLIVVVGPSARLDGLVKKQYPEKQIIAVQTCADIADLEKIILETWIYYGGDMMAIEKQDTAKEVIAIVIEKLNIKKPVGINQSTLQDLGADSLDMVEIIMKLEEQFGIEINDDEAEKLSSIQEVINYVHNLRIK